MRWMLLLVAISGCAGMNRAPAAPGRVASAPIAPDYDHERLAAIEKDIGDAKSQEQEPVYVTCRTAITETCIRLVDAHQSLMSHLYGERDRLVDRIKATESEDRLAEREAAAQPTALQRAAAAFSASRREEKPKRSTVCRPDGFGNLTCEDQ